MARQRGGTAPRRPTVPAAKPAPAPASARPHSTAAAPAAGAHPPPPAAAQAQAPVSQGPGLFGQMASTAAGVAVGSSIGHAVGGWFSGGSSAPAEASPQNADFAAQHQNASSSMSQMQQATGPCANDVNSFRKCMDENQGSLTICGWYLDQLKACQAAAGQY
ncbi:hypothetical protein LEMA_P113550.1 [Plenodomus lingam JN3]|uniref:CHCH domain-containing protein n=2 Tax=Leptosphaeria maculans TaxID=5022 RepID=E4ZU61_LEPMJ|nr:hypothetical protein LEMA_P113550.1 [Plenodomus lingam JN3]CBX94940.1 hypothetical protein LEMA_P113550.1 [Plenodomus lingam JN3]